MPDQNPGPDAASRELEAQLRRLETIADPASRSAARDLVAAVLQFHAAALERMLQVMEEQSDDSGPIFAAFDRDPLIRSILLLHDLHPDSLEARVAHALAELRPRLEKRGATVELISTDEGVVRARVSANGHAHGPLGPAVEEALRNAAPDALQVVVEERGASPGTAFVPLATLQNAAPAETPASAARK